MINNLKGSLDRILIEIEMGDTPAAMREIAHFTMHFDQFLKEYKDYIFLRELQDLNSCMVVMLGYMEQNDLVSLKEVITKSFMGYLDKWDFNNRHWVN